MDHHRNGPPELAGIKVEAVEDFEFVEGAHGTTGATVENKEGVVIRGLDGLKPVLKTYKFTLDFNVFNSLVSATYQRICAAHPEYFQNISYGMFSYYCGTALWYRLYQVKFLQGEDYAFLFPQWNATLEPFVLPKPISEFLNFIGDFLEPEHKFYWKLEFPQPNAAGHFGQMTADSFYKYMAYPAPAVLVRALHQELDVITDKVELHSDWRLEDIDFDGLSPDLAFSYNVCGYYHLPNFTVHLNKPDDLIGKLLSNIFVEPGVDYEFKQKKLINSALHNYITTYHGSISKYPMEKYDNNSKYGSSVQMGFAQFSLKKDDGSEDVCGFSPVMLQPSLGNLIPVLRLRLKRLHCVDAYPYDYSSIDDVPADWRENLNAYFDYGDVKNRGWNYGLFSTGSIQDENAISEYVGHFSKSVKN